MHNLPKDHKPLRTLQIIVTPEEYRDVRMAAIQRDMSVSALLRSTLGTLPKPSIERTSQRCG